MKKLMVVLVCLAVMGLGGTGWAEPYRILHKEGAIYNTDTGWTLTTPPYYPGVEWAVDLVVDAQGVTILHKDGAMWKETGGWDMSSPPYYAGSAYAQALDAGPEEVRMPISSLPYTITQSGSYYITGDLTSAGLGISVEADNVTIDLMGYSLIGPGSGVNYLGIVIQGSSNVEIRNGTVTDFGSVGIYCQGATDARIIDVRVMGNPDYGIDFQACDASLVKDCTVSDNSLYGISVGYGSTVTGNIAYDNGYDGIHTKQGCTVTGNTAYGNGNHGIYLGDYNVVDGNTAYNNNQSSGGYPDMNTCATCAFGVNIPPPAP